ncbi:MAG: small multi-drug export protein [Flavobacteriaceae bacterium]|nr:small multi-drug export protein [Flavobacteriaceae bacterium]
MIKEIIFTILWSFSPLGEAKVGIPYGMHQNLNIYFVFILAVVTNILVFPFMMFFLDKINKHLLKWYFYKKIALWIARRAKAGSGKKIKKHGFWGILLFVMIPLPGTGVYAGSIATYMFKIERKKAFLANAIGITISSVIIWFASYYSINGIA